MKRLLAMLCVGLFLTLGVSTAAMAIPTLQLDISGGTYGGGPDGQTILATSDAFSLYALYTLGPKETAVPTDQKFFVTASVYPLVTTNVDLGTFNFDGATINVTSDMLSDSDLTPDGLPTHGAFPSAFVQKQVYFDDGQINPYDSQLNPGGFTNTPGSGTFFTELLIDVSNLAEGYYIHFDLLARDLQGNFLYKAPFSHDAQSDGAPVPEPTTVLLLVLGLIGVAGFSRKKFIR